MIRHFHLDLVSQRAVLHDTLRELIRLGRIQKVLNDWVERLFNDKVALHLDRIEVLEKTIAEEVMKDMKAILVSVIWVIDRSARARYSFDHTLLFLS